MKKNIKTNEKSNNASQKMPKEINVNEIISKTARAAAIETLESLKSNRFLKDSISYFRKVEILLYNYNKLKEAVKQKDEDIEYIEKNGLPEKSGSIVIYQTGGGNITSQERYVQLIEKYKLEKAETVREIKRIDNVLRKIRDDKYYKIIELRYLNAKNNDNVSDSDIAEILDKDQTTITRNRKRLINNIKVILFPESIKDFA